MEKRFQVFVSSTYEDLRVERLEVFKALLELDCMPSGMEYFPAADDDQWTFIKKLIAGSDYYIAIIGARYGSLHSSGLSYTQMEYNYAIAQNVPTLVFIQQDAERILSDVTNGGDVQKHRQFIQQVRERLCKEWSDAHHLAAVVSRGLTQQIRRTPRTGWVRADEAFDQSEEGWRLKSRIEELQGEMQNLRSSIVTYTDKDFARQVKSLSLSLGYFPVYFFHVAELVASAKVHLRIDCIFPAHGLVPDEMSSKKYRLSLQQRIAAGIRVTVSCIRPSLQHTTLARLIESSGMTWHAWKMSRSLPLERYLFDHSSPYTVGSLTMDQFLAMRAADDIEMLETTLRGATVEFFDTPPPFCLWAADDRAIFTLRPKDGLDHGFYTDDHKVVEGLYDLLSHKR